MLKVISIPAQQGNIQLCQGLLQIQQTAFGEAHTIFAAVMLQPLRFGTQETSDDSATLSLSLLAGGKEGRVIMQAKIGAKPNQLRHYFRLSMGC